MERHDTPGAGEGKIAIGEGRRSTAATGSTGGASRPSVRIT